MIRELPAGAWASVAELAARLAARPGLFVLATAPATVGPGEQAVSFLGVDPVERSAALVPPTGERARGRAGERAAPRWVGLVPYEAVRFERPGRVSDQRPAPTVERPVWHRYDAVLGVDHDAGRLFVEADDEAAAQRLVDRLAAAPPSGEAPRSAPFAVGPLAWNDDDDAHAAKVRRVLAELAAGEAYQVNLARRASFAFRGDPLAFFFALAHGAPSPFGFYLAADDFVACGTSPELALDVRGRRLRTMPIKGTRPRGDDATADDALRADLAASDKEGAELTMAVDLHRNDLGRVGHGVRVLGAPRISLGRTVMSRFAEVVAELDDGASLADVVRAVVPWGSVTGAPKVRAMELIAELESARRGLYTGVVGTLRRDGDLTLAMAIRTAVLTRRGVAWDGEYFSGGGIVVGSEPESEAAETRWKAAQLLRLASLGLPSAEVSPGRGPL